MPKNSFPLHTVHVLVMVALAFLWFSCGDSETDRPIQKASWLLGTWENKTPRGSIFETWEKNGQDAFIGKTYTINGKDTLYFESVELRQLQDSLYYIPTVKDQNEGLPVTFSLNSMTDTSMVFMNPEHDFPQIIRYHLIHQDSLDAYIAGMKDGEQRTILFPMRRIH